MINENVLDHVASLMAHYFHHFPDQDEVSAEALAAMVREHGVCPQYIGDFCAFVGADSLAEAIEKVWDSALWEAFDARNRGEATVSHRLSELFRLHRGLAGPARRHRHGAGALVAQARRALGGEAAARVGGPEAAALGGPRTGHTWKASFTPVGNSADSQGLTPVL